MAPRTDTHTSLEEHKLPLQSTAHIIKMNELGDNVCTSTPGCGNAVVFMHV